MRISIILIVFSLFLLPAAFAQTGEIHVKISDIEKMEGILAIGLFNKSRGFPEINKAYKGVFLKVTAKEIEYSFSGIQPGEYAIAVFHDSNNNGKIDKNFLGIPKEGYGFSNNATGIFGPPDFDEAKFQLDSNYTVKIKIEP